MKTRLEILKSRRDDELKMSEASHRAGYHDAAMGNHKHAGRIARQIEAEENKGRPATWSNKAHP